MKLASSVLALGVGLLLCAGAASATTAPSAACPPATSTPLTASLTEATAPPPPAAETLVACIATKPILGATLAHWTAIAERSAAPSGKAPAGATGAVPLANEALGFLISSDWLLGEARALHIDLTRAQVRHDYDRIRAKQFPKLREFHKFLHSSGETIPDLLFRVRLNLTSQRIQRRVEAGRGSKKSQARSLAQFIERFKRKWQAQTYCAAAYVVNDCGRSF
ncbi:MAG TPA: hypothetical protein VK761_04905 [Solirubrobacteraceae bacterium]|jgi:hypothetical protein|nr:hypothetical protein [Solirubrobacteraceae bacterium]